ncbi:hypothetical protein GCM10010502_22410 [Kitasatospora aureofaciens]|uniref:4'-phosphopantetheinyl transferase superfamily protein n=1 Tax=Kitasatospora aureofaciens TaxID=1894 RepID=A0A8H9HML2_KITAU|nr:hypothetical protein GCM10010502_22410 [Kitasatospora aureofaciens]
MPRRGRAAPSGSWSPRGWASAFVAEAAEPAERSARFTALWCRGEARVKAYGGRLIQALGVSAGPSPLLLIDPRPLGRSGGAVRHTRPRAAPGPPSPRSVTADGTNRLYWQVS